MADKKFTDRKAHEPKAPRNYLSHKEQRKLLALIMGVGLVVLVVSEVRHPERWRGLWQGEQAANSPDAEVDYSKFDTSYRPQSTAEDPETVRILPRQPVDIGSSRYFPGVDPLLLREVEDYSPFRAVDGKPWFQLLGILQKSDSAVLKSHSVGEVSFVQLYDQPEVYRGELVTLRGTVKRATKQSASRNSQGIEGYHQLVLQPLDGPLRPIAIKVLELPPQFPVDDKIREDIAVTGFFFKNQVYLAEDGHAYIMPVVLAKDIAWQPVVPVERWTPSNVAVWMLLGGMAGLAALISLFVYYRSNAIRLPGGHELRNPLPGNFEALQNAPVKTVSEHLDEMAGNRR